MIHGRVMLCTWRKFAHASVLLAFLCGDIVAAEEYMVLKKKNNFLIFQVLGHIVAFLKITDQSGP